MDLWLNGKINKFMNGLMINGWIDQWMDEWMKKYEWMDWLKMNDGSNGLRKELMGKWMG